MNALTYTLVVNGPLYGTQSSRSAYQFAKALVESRHQLVNVFFYQDGVTNGNGLSVPAHDEFDIVQAWQRLAKEHHVALETCIAASLRRGIVSQKEASLHGLSQSNLADGFEQAGLGRLAQALLTQDRVVQF